MWPLTTLRGAAIFKSGECASISHGSRITHAVVFVGAQTSETRKWKSALLLYVGGTHRTAVAVHQHRRVEHPNGFAHQHMMVAIYHWNRETKIDVINNLNHFSLDPWWFLRFVYYSSFLLSRNMFYKTINTNSCSAICVRQQCGAFMLLAH